jgi:cation diffusion facilitator family transporter
MKNDKVTDFKHTHNFNLEKKSSENKTKIVLIITLTTMVVEIIAGWIFKSMALFADGWHMSTHATALGISFVAYIMARKHANDKRYAFGTWKIEILGAYTSSILLGVVGLFVLAIAIKRFFIQVKISYDYALIVAGTGLLVNAICALILQNKHDHHHDHDHLENHQNHHADLNIRSAYLHVIADAFTSVFAIIALLGAKFFHWNWLDPFMGIVGSILIFRWTYFLLKDTSGILLDKATDSEIEDKIKNIIESDMKSNISDIHIIRVAQNKIACVVSILSSNPDSINVYKDRLKNIDKIAHLTIEINTGE